MTSLARTVPSLARAVPSLARAVPSLARTVASLARAGLVSVSFLRKIIARKKLTKDFLHKIFI